jgi:hypothetical protein
MKMASLAPALEQLRPTRRADATREPMSVLWHALCLSMTEPISCELVAQREVREEPRPRGVFRILTKDEEQLLSKNYKDIRKQVQDAFKKKS